MDREYYCLSAWGLKVLGIVSKLPECKAYTALWVSPAHYSNFCVVSLLLFCWLLVWGPYLAVLLGQYLGFTPAGFKRPYAMPRIAYKVGHLQGKCPTCCTMQNFSGPRPLMIFWKDFPHHTPQVLVMKIWGHNTFGLGDLGGFIHLLTVFSLCCFHTDPLGSSQSLLHVYPIALWESLAVGLPLYLHAIWELPFFWLNCNQPEQRREGNSFIVFMVPLPKSLLPWHFWIKTLEIEGSWAGAIAQW